MKRRIRRTKLDIVLDSIHQKNPDGLLAIECEFDNFVHGHKFQYLLKDICAGEVTSDDLIVETLESIRTVIRSAENDARNIWKCVTFIITKYPHVIFSGENYNISVNNLTPSEIDDCLSQKDLKFIYYNDMNS
jgi:hypothetical protein